MRMQCMCNLGWCRIYPETVRLKYHREPRQSVARHSHIVLRSQDFGTGGLVSLSLDRCVDQAGASAGGETSASYRRLEGNRNTVLQQLP